MNLAITATQHPTGADGLERFKHMLGISPSRSRILVMLPFLIVLLCVGVSYAMSLRYELAIEMKLPGDRIKWEQFQNNNAFLLLGMGASSFVLGVLIVYAIRSSLRSLTQGIEQAADGHFELPIKPVSEREIDQLQGQIRHMLGALNGMVRDSGMGATIIVDGSGRVQLINPLAQLLLRVSPDEMVGHSFVRVFNRYGAQRNTQVIDLIQQSLQSGDPLRQRSVQMAVDHGRQLSVKLRTSFFVADGNRQMAVNLLDYDLNQVTDIRDKIERAARFLTLGSLSAHLAHEIRNPLTSIAGLVELLKSETPDEQTKLEYIHHIETSADRLNHLIEGLMDFSAIEKCELSLNNIGKVIDDVVQGAAHEPRWQDKLLRWTKPDLSPQVNCNRRWMSQALINLLDNACDATPVGGAVSVAVDQCRDEESSEWLDIKVHNTGSYIEPDRRRLIFEPFETGKSTGTGLGLSIVQEIVQAHGGSVQVQSSETDGTTFVIRLPQMESAEAQG